MIDTEDWPLAEAFLKRIGIIAVLWSVIEAQMEIAILRIQEINLSTGMVVSSELGFRSKWNLLMTAANEPGGIGSETEAKALKSLLDRIGKAYPKRNAVIHPVWVPTQDPKVAKRKGIRAKGKLQVIDEPVSVDALSSTIDEIHGIGVDLTAFMERNGFTPEGGSKNAL